MHLARPASIVFAVSLFPLTGAIADNGSLLETGWKRNGFATPLFEINGTESRNNPIRKKLKQPFTGDQIFVRFRLRYFAESVDLPPEDEGEFVVLWLDQTEGNHGATHSGGVPNVGIHVSGDQNRFMVRYESSRERYGAELVGDRDFLIVARLWKSQSGESKPYDQLDLWVDPKPTAEFKPHASVSSQKAISKIGWVGFSTGAKTEIDDRIFVWDVDLAIAWNTILQLPPESPTSLLPQKIARRTIDFDQHVFPILESKCFSCHSGDDVAVRLDVHDEVMNLCSLGNAADSRLYQMVSSREMPPQDERQLSQEEIKILATWIDERLVWNETRLPTPQPTTDHWAFQPIVRPKVPKVDPSRSSWIRSPVDAFIARKQQAMGVFPSPPADLSTLTRRMSLDLLGLPPTNVKMDPNVDLVQQLLNNPAYGQRWGRHWLDVARWAESNGHQHNRFRPHAWRYRDWVVDAFNRDLPFDEFLAAQIAGDEMPPQDVKDEGRLVATGFLAAARYSGNELDKRIQRNDILVDVVNTTTNAFLGLTFQCAQCHAHKFDPISLRDYYRMQAFFASGQPGNVSLTGDDDRAAELVRERWEIFDRTLDRLVNIRRRQGVPNPELIIPKTVIAKMTPPDKKRFQELEKQIASLSQTWAYYSPGAADRQRVVAPHDMRWPLPRAAEAFQQIKTYMLLRGDVNAPGPELEPGWPLVFGITNGELGQRPRIALARWMTSERNPLTARVWVNRIWYWHFGHGLVETVEDFGKQGTPPTHPELLDYLAAELMEHNWSTHHIHRLILNSATYRQSTSLSAENSQLDPGNTTYWRWLPRRLEAEAIRDCMLAVSGELNLATGGPSDADLDDSKRRSLYLRQHRERFPDQQVLFDSAGGVVSCSRRIVSTNALQPMWLLNSRFSQGAARALADRAGSVGKAFRICLGREAAPQELTALQTHAGQHGLASACLVLMNMNEFLYIP